MPEGFECFDASGNRVVGSGDFQVRLIDSFSTGPGTSANKWYGTQEKPFPFAQVDQVQAGWDFLGSPHALSVSGSPGNWSVTYIYDQAITQGVSVSSRINVFIGLGG